MTNQNTINSNWVNNNGFIHLCLPSLYSWILAHRRLDGGAVEADAKRSRCGVTIAIIIYFTIEMEVGMTRITIWIFHLIECTTMLLLLRPTCKLHPWQRLLEVFSRGNIYVEWLRLYHSIVRRTHKLHGNDWSRDFIGHSGAENTNIRNGEGE